MTVSSPSAGRAIERSLAPVGPTLEKSLGISAVTVRRRHAEAARNQVTAWNHDSESIAYRAPGDISPESVVALYRALQWSSAEKPETLHRALLGSHLLVTAWDGERLIGLGNAISDGDLVAYFPHLLVHPDYQAAASAPS